MAAASGALRAIEKEILVEALRRFGYDAMDCISEELQRDEETVCAFYEDAVAALRKLLWRSGVRLQAAMAWDSPAMIAAVVKSWGFLKAKVGVESASFAHLGHYLSQPEALAIVQDFTESAQKYKHPVLFDEKQLEEAFKFRGVPRSPTPPPDPAHGRDQARMERLMGDAGAVQPERDAAPSGAIRAESWSEAISLWICPEDDRVAGIMANAKVKDSACKILVQDANITVEKITGYLQHKWADNLHATFEERQTMMAFERFELGAIPPARNAMFVCARPRWRATARAAPSDVHGRIAGSAHRRAAARRGGAGCEQAAEQAVLQVRAGAERWKEGGRGRRETCCSCECARRVAKLECVRHRAS
eukprot:2262775-Rhodomonas_salina.1